MNELKNDNLSLKKIQFKYIITKHILKSMSVFNDTVN